MISSDITPSPVSTSPAIVLGAGPAGLATALALSHAGVPVTLIDSGLEPARDRRTSALMAASVRMLDRLGVWEHCRHVAAPLKTLRIIDDTRRLLRAPTVEFAASEIGEEAFGWNIPNSDLVMALGARCGHAQALTRVVGRAEHIEPGTGRVNVRLADGRVLSADLLIAADGRNSPSRKAAAIGVDEWSYGQAAIVLNLSHERPHEYVSTEFHTPNGPFTLVPLKGNRSSLVWVDRQPLAEAMAVFDHGSLAREIERLSHRILGAVEIETPPAVFPLHGLNARRFASRRVALVGEAAHVMPPIGAQGLNLGLRDAASVAEIVGAAAGRGEDIGEANAMKAYDRARRFDVMSRTGAVDALNRSLLTGFVPVQMLRVAGLAALGGVGPMRRFFMREGIAPHVGLPRLMRREDSAVLDVPASGFG